MQQAIPGAALDGPGRNGPLGQWPSRPGLRFTAAAVAHLIGVDIERGEAIRRAVLGDAHVDQARTAPSEFTAPFTDFITRYAWGEVWSRPWPRPPDPFGYHAGGSGGAWGAVGKMRWRCTFAGRTAATALHLVEEIREVSSTPPSTPGCPHARSAFLVADKGPAREEREETGLAERGRDRHRDASPGRGRRSAGWPPPTLPAHVASQAAKPR